MLYGDNTTLLSAHNGLNQFKLLWPHTSMVGGAMHRYSHDDMWLLLLAIPANRLRRVVNTLRLVIDSVWHGAVMYIRINQTTYRMGMVVSRRRA